MNYKQFDLVREPSTFHCESIYSISPDIVELDIFFSSNIFPAYLKKVCSKDVIKQVRDYLVAFIMEVA